MHTILFIFYSLVCGFAIVRMPFIRNSRIRPTLLLLLFALHVFTGLAHNIIAYRYYPEHGDIWDNFWKSFMYRHRLVSDFGTFLANNASWTHVSHNGLIFIQMILNVFSLDHLDINTLLFSFPVFLGNIALFRVFRHRFPDDLITAGAVFLLPSILFWTSCIHREGILYMLIGFLLLGLHRMITGEYTRLRLLRSIGCFLLIFYFRSAMALTLLPAVFIWLSLEKPRARPLLWKVAAAASGFAILLVLLLPGFHLPATLASWQKEFYNLEGHSRLPLPELDGSWASLLRILPPAVLNGFFQPLPGSGGQPIYLAFSIELLAIWTIVLLALLCRTIGAPLRRTTGAPLPWAPVRLPPVRLPFSIFCLLFSLTGMLLVGMFIPFAGAIVRYRSIYLLFLLAPFLHALCITRPLTKLNAWLSRHALNKL
ncbi:MAG TPA: hypothetical protein VNU70_11285 [Puia sp.]|jgi:hypothetical protein|nr:hypothetical protein [Puia sp.]